ncbi:MAG: adenylate/guanylate cyclase domain-containing protein [Gammaproteobacteria bacterium]
MPESRTLAVLFADVCASTMIYERLGDVRGLAVVGRCVELMAAATRAHDGTVVKTIGDEVMATFAHADAAAAAAVRMQREISGRVSADGEGVAIRIGFCAGSVLVEEGDVFGDAVNLASRMASLARPGEILAPRATVEQLTGQWREETRQIDRTRVKGKAAAIDVFELNWEAEEVTRMKPMAWESPPEAGATRMSLALGGQRIDVGDDHPTVTVGRGAQNDLVTAAPLASRLHARIEYRNGHFVLTDQSTNGCFVAAEGAAVEIVRHDSHVLTGAGLIGLGEAPRGDAADALRWRVGG